MKSITTMKTCRISCLLLIIIFSANTSGDLFLYDEWGQQLSKNTVAITPFDTFEIQVYSDDDSDWSGYLVLDEFILGSGELNNPRTFSEAGVNGSHSAFSQTGIGTGYELVSSTATSPGFQHAVDFSPWEAGGYWFSLYDASIGFDVPVEYFSIYCGAGVGSGARAEADGPYAIDVGEEITLSGRHSGWNGIDGGLEWSLEGHYIGTDEMQQISYDTLVNDFGLLVGEHQVQIRAWAHDWDTGALIEDFDTATLTITPEPASISLILLGGLLLTKKR